MRKVREVLQLTFEAKLSHERIAAATGVSKGAVANYVRRALQQGLGWPLAEDLDDGALERVLFASQQKQHVQPDCACIHKQLSLKGVTLQLLWEEYRGANGQDAYRYSQFCEYYKRFRDKLKRSMRQVHRAGEKVFIDYSGTGITVIDQSTGEITQAQIFVAVLGASKYTYAEATWTQTIPDWIASHIRMLEFFGCVLEIFVPDNLKPAIKHACRYEPAGTSTYMDMARHYGAVIIPARPLKPKDKANVETGVLLAQRWILARLRNRQFFKAKARPSPR